MAAGSPDDRDRKTYWKNLTLAGLAGQVGCLTLVIILGSIFLGLWLDSQFQTRPAITIILVLVSIPISLGAMFFVARQTVKRIKTGPPTEKKSNRSEEDGIGK